MDLSTQISSLDEFKAIDSGFLSTDWKSLGDIDNPIQTNTCELASACQLSINTQCSVVKLQNCAFDDFNYNFNEADGVLIADKNKRSAMVKFPLRLTFQQPVRAIGTQISIDGKPEANYFGMMQLNLGNDIADDYWQVRGTLSSARGSAPFIGAKAAPGKLISEAWFDAVYISNVPASRILMVAINTLYVLP